MSDERSRHQRDHGQDRCMNGRKPAYEEDSDEAFEGVWIEFSLVSSDSGLRYQCSSVGSSLRYLQRRILAFSILSKLDVICYPPHADSHFLKQ